MWAQVELAIGLAGKDRETSGMIKKMAITHCRYCYHWQDDDYCISEITPYQPCIWFIESEEVYKYFSSCGQAVRTQGRTSAARPGDNSPCA
ncbi:MAG: hypothetical protein HUU09_05525 [Candidatus Jettenia caeni]|nr:hypothetical protein [Candidatus Jettenia caeni]UJS18301.1 MAG: hypothetical protein L3J17_04370 [Candidatus Jettenia sp.]